MWSWSDSQTNIISVAEADDDVDNECEKRGNVRDTDSGKCDFTWILDLR